MSDYVDKIRKSGVEYEIRDTNGRPKIEQSSIVLAESDSVAPAPTPVATFDGVDYYHKIETKDLSEGVYYNMLGEETTSSEYPRVYGSTRGGSMIFFNVISTARMQLSISGNQGASSNVGEVEILSASDTSGKQGLSDEFFTAGYFEIDEEYNGTLYFNLKSEDNPVYVHSVKQGNAVFPIRDARVPQPTSEDNGKAIKVNAQGALEFGDAKDARIPDPQNADYGKFLHVNESTGAFEYGNAGGEFTLVTTKTISIDTAMAKGDIYVGSGGAQVMGDPSKPYIVKPRSLNVYGFYNQMSSGSYAYGFIALSAIDGSQTPVEIKLDVFQLA